MGLELKPSKTRIAHTLKQYEPEKPGFEFLGFNIRQYPTGKYQSGKTTKGERLLGFKTIITPSKEIPSSVGATSPYKQQALEPFQFLCSAQYKHLRRNSNTNERNQMTLIESLVAPPLDIVLP
jgi:hypothetical protein